MTVRENSLKFVKLSGYATCLVSNSIEETGRFLIGISEDLEEECREDMHLSKLMVQQAEESRKRKHNRARNRSRQAEEIF